MFAILILQLSLPKCHFHIIVQNGSPFFTREKPQASNKSHTIKLRGSSFGNACSQVGLNEGHRISRRLEEPTQPHFGLVLVCGQSVEVGQLAGWRCTKGMDAEWILVISALILHDDFVTFFYMIEVTMESSIDD